MTMPYETGGEELLEYQTEQDDPGPVQPLEPLPVHVCEPVITIATVSQHLTALSRVLTAAQPSAQILAQDPLRTRAQVLVVGANKVVLCHSLGQAQNPNNLDATLAAPDGAVLTSAYPVPVETTQPVWVVANTFPTTVSVLIERRTA